MRELAQLAVLGNKCSGKSDVSCAMMSMPAESTGLLGINSNNIKQNHTISNNIKFYIPLLYSAIFCCILRMFKALGDHMLLGHGQSP